MYILCGKWVETRTDCHINPSSSHDQSSTSFASWLRVAQPVVTKGQKPSICSWLSLRYPVSNWLEPPGHLVILFSNVHLLPLFLYWPSTEPSIKRCTCVNKRKNSGSRWTLEIHIALILLGKVWIQLFFLQLWVNSRTD